MDGEPSSSFSSSMLFKASIISISFTSIYFYKTGTNIAFWKPLITSKETEVKIQPVKIPVKKKQKTIYLTFDDGPCKGTKTVLSILKKTATPASFFIIGEHVYGSKEQTAIYDSLKNCDLIEIDNHGYTHANHNKFYEFYSNADDAVKDFYRTKDSLDLTNNIVRTPGRNIWRTKNINFTDLKNSTAAADSIQSNGFTAVGWDMEWHFNSEQRLVQTDVQMINDIDSVMAKHKTKIPNHIVLLTHDRTFSNPADSAMLHRFINTLIQRDDYNFEVVAKYPDLQVQ
jgi:peptidoglycan-N-acetylglucosamine deacetylase